MPNDTEQKFNAYGVIADAIDKELNSFISPAIWGTINALEEHQRQEKFPHILYVMQIQAEVLRAFINEYIDSKIVCGDMLADMAMNKVDACKFMDNNTERLKVKLGKDEIKFR